MSKKKSKAQSVQEAVDNAQFAHHNTEGVTMFCEECLREYFHVHPTEPAFCNAGHKPVRVRPAKHILAVTEVVTRFFVRNKLF